MMTYLSQYPNAKLQPNAPLRPKANPSRYAHFNQWIKQLSNKHILILAQIKTCHFTSCRTMLVLFKPTLFIKWNWHIYVSFLTQTSPTQVEYWDGDILNKTAMSYMFSLSSACRCWFDWSLIIFWLAYNPYHRPLCRLNRFNWSATFKRLFFW